MSRGIEAATWGNAIRDGEVRTSRAGNEFGMVTIAVNEGKDDNGKDVASFIKVFLFGHLAHEAEKINKGDRCYCEGQLTASVWQPESGPARPDITLKAFRFMRTGIGKQRPPRNGDEAQQSIRGHSAPEQEHQPLHDSIPF
jgi:single-stranded DNA-binding protein